jgi:hypothetical protein
MDFRPTRHREAVLALVTCMTALADLSLPLELARLDTNDLPTAADAVACDWTSRVLDAV